MRELQRRVELGLGRAECEGSCYVPSDRPERLAVRRRAGEILEPVAGAFVRRDTWSGLAPTARALWIMRAVSRQHPTWRFCGTSAAVVYGLPIAWGLLARIQVATPPRASSRALPGVEHHVISGDDPEFVDRLPVTSFWRTVFDCLATLPGADALAVADRALSMNGMSARQLCDLLSTRFRGHPGVRRALDVARLSDGRSESPGESIARYTMHELGLAEPALQVWIEDPIEPGRWFRVDFLWMLPDKTIVIGEHDGRGKTSSPQLTGPGGSLRALQDERLRESHLTALHAAIARFSYDDARDPERLGAILRGFGVPLRTQNASLPHQTQVVESVLCTLEGWLVLATTEVIA